MPRSASKPMSHLLGLALSATALLLGAATASEIPPAASVVRTEALRSQHDPTGRPLPLVAHWHRQSLPLSFQLQMIRDGHPLLPWLDYNRELSPDRVQAAYGDGLRTLKEWNLPFALITGGQWEQDFYLAKQYKDRPLDETGLATDLEGKPIRKVSPFSPVGPWRALGRKWTDNPGAMAIQALYPDPPLVLFVSNNEAQKLRWHEAETSKQYLDRFGTGQSGDFKRRVFGDGWIERYSALFQGMREGLAEPAWRANARFAGYNAFGPDHWGCWGGWPKHSLHTEERMSPSWYAWQGGIKDAYDNHWEGDKTAFTVWSMQTETMNLVFMRDAAFEVQPDFWFELIFWDGNLPGKPNDKYLQYRNHGIEYTPELYGGWVQYGLWLLTPRVAREWRSSADDRQRWWRYFEQIIAAVDRVHADPVLTRFWRKGRLVENPARQHPFQSRIPKKWRDVPRWYHLDTSLDPPHPWELDQRVPVWTLARVIGAAPAREWLIYAHAPMGDTTGVSVTIPDFGRVTLPRVPVGGAFFHLKEAGGALQKVGGEPTPTSSRKPG
jgi:hypothetical protein